MKNSHVVYGQDVEITASRTSSVSHPAATGSSKVNISLYDFDHEPVFIISISNPHVIIRIFLSVPHLMLEVLRLAVFLFCLEMMYCIES